MLAITVAWDNALSWTWDEAIDSLEATMQQVHKVFNRFCLAYIIALREVYYYAIN